MKNPYQYLFLICLIVTCFISCHKSTEPIPPIPEDKVFQINSYSEEDQDHAQVVKLNNGNIAVVWRSDLENNFWGSIKGQILDSEGNRVGNELDIWMEHNAHIYAVTVTATSNGFLVQWLLGLYDTQIYGLFLDDEGNKIGNIVSYDTGTIPDRDYNNIDSDLLTNGDIVTVYSTCNWVFFIIQDDLGHVKAEHVVDSLSQSCLPRVCSLYDNSFVIVWEYVCDTLFDEESIKMQTFNAEGGATSNQAILATEDFLNNFSLFPKVIPNENGYYVTWSAIKFNDPDTLVIQKYDVQGNLLFECQYTEWIELGREDYQLFPLVNNEFAIVTIWSPNVLFYRFNPHVCELVSSYQIKSNWASNVDGICLSDNKALMVWDDQGDENDILGKIVKF